ncbi:MAG: ankyrin repeat domain-containing protein [Candidatus Binatia bacterium]
MSDHDAETADHDGAKHALTPLHHAAHGCQKEIAELLIANGANVNSPLSNGATPLHVAAAAGHKVIVELLVANGANVSSARSDGQTPVHVASQKGHKEIAELLVAKTKAVRVLLWTDALLRCGGCATSFAIGRDAVAVSVEFAMSLGKEVVIFSDGHAPQREDLVSSLDDVPVDKRQAALERAKPSWQFIQDSLARGERRTWRCAKCNRGANRYPLPEKLDPISASGVAKAFQDGHPKVVQSLLDNEVLRIGKCDVCSAETRFVDAYALTTREVTCNTNYWKYLMKKDAQAFRFGGNELLKRFAIAQAGQSTGWLICEKCSGLFEFNKAVAKEYAAKEATPPNCGPVDYEDVIVKAMVAQFEIEHGI